MQWKIYCWRGNQSILGLHMQPMGSWYLGPSVHALLVLRQHVGQELEGLQIHCACHDVSPEHTAGQCGNGAVMESPGRDRGTAPPGARRR